MLLRCLTIPISHLLETQCWAWFRFESAGQTVTLQPPSSPAALHHRKTRRGGDEHRPAAELWPDEPMQKVAKQSDCEVLELIGGRPLLRISAHADQGIFKQVEIRGTIHVAARIHQMRGNEELPGLDSGWRIPEVQAFHFKRAGQGRKRRFHFRRDPGRVQGAAPGRRIPEPLRLLMAVEHEELEALREFRGRAPLRVSQDALDSLRVNRRRVSARPLGAVWSSRDFARSDRRCSSTLYSRRIHQACGRREGWP